MRKEWNQRPVLAGALLVALTFLVYLPALRSGFVWDDEEFLFGNPLILAADGLRDIWISTQSPDYFPLTSSTLWLEWRLFGAEHPGGYHFTNVLLHALSSLLLWRLLARLAVPGAWLAALIFALHPVNVEAVAWITQRKSTLPMTLGLLSMLLYFPNGKEPGGAASGSARPTEGTRYALSLFCFLLALLSKTSVVSIPAVLLLLSWWKNGSLARRDIARALPFFAIGVLLALVTIWFQSHRAIGEAVIREDGLLSRLAIAGRAFWFYLSKALLPLDLAFVYPRWELNPAGASAWLPTLLAALLLLASWTLRARHWARAAFTSLAIYLAMLLPVLGFFNIFFMRYSLVADHWQYPAIPAVIAAVAALLTRGAARLHKRGTGRVLAAALLVPLAILTWRQADCYRDQETLWRATLEVNPAATLAHYNLGVLLTEGGRPGEALASFERTLEIDPLHFEAIHNRALHLLRIDRPAEAEAGYRRALEVNPDYAEAHHSLGHLLLESGRGAEAIAHFDRALSLKPNYAEAWNHRGMAFYAQGNIEEAIASCRMAIESKPGLELAHNNLGIALTAKGELEEAIDHFRRATEIRPDFADAHYNLGVALATAGRVAEAAEPLRRAIESAAASGDSALAEKFREQMRSYGLSDK